MYFSLGEGDKMAKTYDKMAEKNIKNPLSLKNFHNFVILLAVNATCQIGKCTPGW